MKQHVLAAAILAAGGSLLAGSGQAQAATQTAPFCPNGSKPLTATCAVTGRTDTSVSLDWTQDYRIPYSGYFVRTDGGSRVKHAGSAATVGGLAPGSAHRFCISIDYTASGYPDESPQGGVVTTTTGTTAPAPSPSPAPSPGTALWTGDMEEGSLADWSSDSGGGEYNSGAGDSVASTDRAFGGSYGAKMALTGPGGTRLFRWKEARANRDLVYSARFFFPQAYTLTADPNTGRYWNLLQFKSRSTSGANDPLWYLDVTNPAAGRMRLDLIWWHRSLEGPRPGEVGLRRFRQTLADVPVGRWFELKARLVQSKDFDGSLRIWQDGQLIFDMAGIRTSFANCTYNSWCAATEWAIKK
jgi:hypothetical protein